MIRSTSVDSSFSDVIDGGYQLTSQGAIKLMTLILRPSPPTAEELQDEQEEKEWVKNQAKIAKEKKEAAREAREKVDKEAEAVVSSGKKK